MDTVENLDEIMKNEYIDGYIFGPCDLSGSYNMLGDVYGEKITDVIKCKNPRCITTTEQELPHVFRLTDQENKVYRCIYCDAEN